MSSFSRRWFSRHGQKGFNFLVVRSQFITGSNGVDIDNLQDIGRRYETTVDPACVVGYGEGDLAHKLRTFLHCSSSLVILVYHELS